MTWGQNLIKCKCISINTYTFNLILALSQGLSDPLKNTKGTKNFFLKKTCHKVTNLSQDRSTKSVFYNTRFHI